MNNKPDERLNRWKRLNTKLFGDDNYPNDSFQVKVKGDWYAEWSSTKRIAKSKINSEGCDSYEDLFRTEKSERTNEIGGESFKINWEVRSNVLNSNKL